MDMVRMWQKWPALMPYDSTTLSVSAYAVLKYVMAVDRINARGDTSGR